MIRSGLIAATLVCVSATGVARANGARLSGDEKTLYALGQQIGRGLSAYGLTKAELAVLARGLGDAATGATPAVEPEKYRRQMIALREARYAAQLEKNKAKGKAHLANAAKEKGAVSFASGLVFKELTRGSGASPAMEDRVTVHFRGKLVDGTEIDNTYARNAPARFPLHESVIPCWTEGLRKMRRGGKARFTCPASIAFGDLGRPPNVPGGVTVTYEFELLDFERRPAN